MKRKPLGHDDWDRWAIPGEPYNGPVDPTFYATGSAHSVSETPRKKRKRKIGFRPPEVIKCP